MIGSVSIKVSCSISGFGGCVLSFSDVVSGIGEFSWAGGCCLMGRTSNFCFCGGLFLLAILSDLLVGAVTFLGLNFGRSLIGRTNNLGLFG